MTTTQFILALLALIIAIVNPWLVARSNRRKQQAAQEKPTRPQLIAKLRKLAIGGLALDVVFILASFFFFYRFLTSDGAGGFFARFNFLLAIVYVLLVTQAFRNLKIHWGQFKESFELAARVSQPDA